MSVAAAPSRWVCAYCVAAKGLRGADLPNWPLRDDAEAIARHLESEHHIPVRREGESKVQAMERFSREQPQAGGPGCKCPTCASQRRSR